jgi:deoxyribonucleoside regulator
MGTHENKYARLTEIAKMYYERNMTQSDIAKEINVSRPMVSKLLTEARDLGVVTIKINHILSPQQMLSDRLKELFGLKEAMVIEAAGGDTLATDLSLALTVYEFLKSVSGGQSLRVGLGCGSTVGTLTELVENSERVIGEVNGEIFPLIGGIKASLRSYHTNELVRSFSESTGLRASYLYLPALVESEEEKNLYQNTELFKGIEEKWDAMTLAILNVSNLFSTPDLATAIRFGKRLSDRKAVGRILAHYFDINGNMIEPENDNVVQIGINRLKSTETVIAMCASNLDTAAVLGVLRTGIVTHVVISDELASKAISHMSE